MTPLISVCIANYNGIHMMDACIESVRGQAGGESVEIIVHDDASTDGSADHLRRCHPDVRLIESAANVGYCVANNRMAVAARGEYLLLLNNDATLLPDALAALLAEARRIAAPAILTLPQYDAETGALIDMGSMLDPFFNSVPNVDPDRHDVGTVAGACLWIPRNLWEEIGGFPEWFGSIAEDLYLCCRARLAGHPVRALGVSGYRHRVGASFGGGKARDGRLSTTFRRRALSERNRTFVMVMTCPAVILPLLLPLHLILLILEGVLLILFRRTRGCLSRIYLPVFMAVWRERGRLIVLRREIQRSHRVGAAEFFSVFDVLPHKFRMWWRHGMPTLR